MRKSMFVIYCPFCILVLTDDQNQTNNFKPPKILDFHIDVIY